MTLRQLISRYTWLNIKYALLHEYPGAQNHLPGYESVYHYLLLLPAADTDLQIELKRIPSTDVINSINHSVDVCGKRQTPHVADAEICIGYALDFTPWAQWLSMPVAAKTLQQFSETEIIAHCLKAIGFHGFDEATVQHKAQSMSSELDFLESMTDAQKQTFLISWEQLGQNRVTKEK